MNPAASLHSSAGPRRHKTPQRLPPRFAGGSRLRVCISKINRAWCSPGWKEAPDHGLGDDGGMASGEEPAAPSPVEPLPAAERGEHWWPVALAVVAVVGLHVALPAKYRVNPAWVVPVVLLGLLAALIVGDPGRIDRQKTWLRAVTGAVIALLTLANLAAAGRLVAAIITTNKLFANNALALLAAGGVIWATNVIAFGLWYWDLDRGGAAARAHHPQPDPAFVFAEMQYTEYTPAGWVPKFADYLSLSFWTATAFSPTDVSAIKRWAKLMMMTEAAVSLVIGILVIARAVNILK
jgi:hypothetical protein